MTVSLLVYQDDHGRVQLQLGPSWRGLYDELGDRVVADLVSENFYAAAERAIRVRGRRAHEQARHLRRPGTAETR